MKGGVSEMRCGFCLPWQGAAPYQLHPCRRARMEMVCSPERKHKPIPRQAGRRNSVRGGPRSLPQLNKRLNVLRKQGAVSLAEELFREAKVRDAVTINTMMKMHAEEDNIEKVLSTFNAFDDCGPQPTVVSYSILVGALASAGMIQRAKQVLDTMDVPPNAVTYLALMKALAREGNVDKLRLLLADMKTRGVARMPATYNVIITGYCNADMLSTAGKVLLEMARDDILPTAATFSPLMVAHARRGEIGAVLDWFGRMNRLAVIPDQHTFAILTAALVDSGRVEHAFRVLQHMLDSKIQPNEVILLAALKAHARNGDLLQVLQCIAKMYNMRGRLREEQVCAAVSALTVCGYDNTAELFLIMASERSDMQVNTAAWNALVKARRSDPRSAERTGVLMCEQGLEPNEGTMCTLLDSYIRAGEFDRASRLASQMQKRMPELGIVGYSTIMKLYREMGDTERVVETFQTVQLKGLRPNEFAYSTLISALGRSADVSGVLAAREEMLEQNIRPNLVVYGALIHALASNEHLGEAVGLLRDMRDDNIQPNSFIYSALVVSLARVGNLNQALQILDGASDEGVDLTAEARSALEQAVSEAT